LDRMSALESVRIGRSALVTQLLQFFQTNTAAICGGVGLHISLKEVVRTNYFDQCLLCKADLEDY